MTCSDKTCIISPIDHFADELLAGISTNIKRIFRLDTRIESLIDDIAFAFDHGRRQYQTTPILEQLSGQPDPSSGTKIVALTEMDLFIPILTHVYGEAQLGGTACIVSTSRLLENLPLVQREKQLHERVIKEVLHELGHTFGLLHCKERKCIMHYCRNIRHVDQKSMELCRYCSVLLDDLRGRDASCETEHHV